MTQQQKEESLALFKHVLEQAKIQLDSTSWKRLRDDLRKDIASRPANLDIRLQSTVLQQTQDIIDTWDEKVERFEKIVKYIESTDAANLTSESIVAAGTE